MSDRITMDELQPEAYKAMFGLGKWGRLPISVLLSKLQFLPSSDGEPPLLLQVPPWLD